MREEVNHGSGGPGHLLRFSQLLGPMPEWHLYDIVEEGEYFERVFEDTMEHILMSEPGDYDDLPWHFSDDATTTLERNN